MQPRWKSSGIPGTASPSRPRETLPDGLRIPTILPRWCKHFACPTGVILSYLNSVPLAGIRDYGEVIGLGDSLWAWYGADFKRVMSLLRDRSPYTDRGSPGEKALALKQVLSLFIAHKRPTYYLRKDTDSLSRACDKYLHLLAEEGILSRELEKLAMEAPLSCVSSPPLPAPQSLVKTKATNAVRIPLMNFLGMDKL